MPTCVVYFWSSGKTPIRLKAVASAWATAYLITRRQRAHLKSAAWPGASFYFHVAKRWIEMIGNQHFRVGRLSPFARWRSPQSMLWVARFLKLLYIRNPDCGWIREVVARCNEQKVAEHGLAQAGARADFSGAWTTASAEILLGRPEV